MKVSVKYDQKARTATVTVTFPTTDQLDKPGLLKRVIEHHLLTDAAVACTDARELVLHQRPVHLTSDVADNPPEEPPAATFSAQVGQ